MTQRTLDDFHKEGSEGQETIECPTCGRSDFSSEHGMKAHHSRTHGEAISTVGDEELILALQSLGDKIGERPTQEEMRINGEYSVKDYTRSFGSWNDGLVAAGYEPHTKCQNTTCEELLADLETLADELGRSPSQSDINEYSERSHKTYYRKFDGGLKEAKERVGLVHYEQPSRSRITVACEYCGAEDEKTPSEIAASNYSYCSRDCVNEHKSDLYSGRGNPASTLEPVQCEGCRTMVNRPRWKREKNDRHYCSDCWGDAKVPIECEQCGGVEKVWPAVATKRRFCSTECMGDWFSEFRVGEDHPRWRGGYEDYYGPNWARQRRKAIIQDQARCQDCDVTEAEFRRLAGEELSVHHRIPRREFITDGELDYEQANRLDNLVALCRPCHSIRETETEYTDY